MMKPDSFRLIGLKRFLHTNRRGIFPAVFVLAAAAVSLPAVELLTSSVGAGGYVGGDASPLILQVGHGPVLVQKPFASRAPQSAEPPADFRWGEVYVFPNPAKGGAAPTVHVEAGAAESVSLWFYDTAGDLVHRADIDFPPPVFTEGAEPRYAYEYSWMGSIPSGTYVCVIQARKAGHPDLRKTVKLGVVR